MSTIPSEEERMKAKREAMMVCAIASGSTLRFKQTFSKPPTAQDLAALEMHLKRWVRATCLRVFKLRRRQIPDFFLDLRSAEWKDDGDNAVTVLLDFGKLFPGERPAEVHAICQEILARYADPQDAVDDPQR